MPKKTKTLKQKKQADQRRQVSPESSSAKASSAKKTTHISQTMATTHVHQTTFSLPTTAIKPSIHKTPVHASQATTIAIDTSDYSYLGKDLLKTGLLTIGIVVAELVFKLFFERG